MTPIRSRGALMRQERSYRDTVVGERRWWDAWDADDFYRRHAPENHFDTLVQHSPLLAQRIAAWLRSEVTGAVEVFDLGSGNASLIQHITAHTSQIAQAHAIDLRERPADVDTSITWHRRDVLSEGLPPRMTDAIPVLIAHEFFDDIPCDLVDVDDAGQCWWMEADETGEPVRGHRVDEASTIEWMHRWWPPRRPGMRIEIGLSRDRLWHSLIRQYPHAIGIVIDYGHTLRERLIGTWDAGTLVGYRDHRVTAPRLDGHTNVTAHVAMDALAAQSDDAHIIRLAEWLGSKGDGFTTGALEDFHILIAHMRG